MFSHLFHFTPICMWCTPAYRNHIRYIEKARTENEMQKIRMKFYLMARNTNSNKYTMNEWMRVWISCIAQIMITYINVQCKKEYTGKWIVCNALIHTALQYIYTSKLNSHNNNNNNNLLLPLPHKINNENIRQSLNLNEISMIRQHFIWIALRSTHNFIWMLLARCWIRIRILSFTNLSK